MDSRPRFKPGAGSAGMTITWMQGGGWTVDESGRDVQSSPASAGSGQSPTIPLIYVVNRSTLADLERGYGGFEDGPTLRPQWNITVCHTRIN